MTYFTLDTQFERLDIPFFAEQALTELSSLTSLTLSEKLKNFARDTRSLSTAFQQDLADYLKQRMFSEDDMSSRFLLKMLLDTTESVLFNAPLPLYVV